MARHPLPLQGQLWRTGQVPKEASFTPAPAASRFLAPCLHFSWLWEPMQQCCCELPFPGDQRPLCLVKQCSSLPEEPLWAELSASLWLGSLGAGPQVEEEEPSQLWGSSAPHRRLHVLRRTQLPRTAPRAPPPQSRHSGSARSLPAGPPPASTALAGALGGPGSGTAVIIRGTARLLCRCCVVALKARVCRLSLRSSFRGPWPGCVPASGRVSRKEDWGLRWEGLGEGRTGPR